MTQIESNFTPEELVTTVQNWHSLITQNPKPPDLGPELRLPLPEMLANAPQETIFTTAQQAALKAITALPLDAKPSAIIQAIEAALETLQVGLDTAVTPTNIHKFDVYDSYFNVSRSSEQSGLTFLSGLLQAYRNALINLQEPPHTLTVIEMPLLRIALETSLRQFEMGG